MAEIKEATNMNTAFHMAEQRTLVHVPDQEEMTIGRSTRADFRIESMGVSSFHVYLKRGKDTQGATIFMATDVSLNGTGMVREGRPATEASPMPRQIPVALPEGSGLLIPMRSSGQQRHGDGPHVLWLRATDRPPAQETVDNQNAKTPASRSPPSTWPTSWASLPNDVKSIWIDEGIETLEDLKSFYTSSDELHAELAKMGVTQLHRDKALTAWRDTTRALATARRQDTPSSSSIAPGPTVPNQQLSVKLKKGPMMMNAPGLWHLRWQKKEREKTEKANKAQGLQPVCTEHMEQVWALFLRAGKSSSLYRNLPKEEEPIFKNLLLRPIRRYPDSMQARLAAWRRWETWVATQPADLQLSPFKPGDYAVGKYLQGVEEGGPTAAANAWAGLKWWATRLGLDLGLDSPLVNDYRFKVQGHTTKQADVLTLEVTSLLRQEAGGRGVRATFASMILLVTGGCIRFLHVQRSSLMNVTDDLAIFRCAKGKRRQHGIREGFRWATPRCWQPAGDTLAKALALIRDVAKKTESYEESPFLIPDMTTSQGNTIDPQDRWLPRPMSYAKFVSLMRTYIADLTGDERPQKMTYNALRRFLPTGADVLKFDATVSAGIGNWQDNPKGSAEKRQGRLKEQMAKRYAGEKVLTAGHYKIQIVAAIWDTTRRTPSRSAGSWSDMVNRYPTKKILYQMTEEFKVNGPATEEEDPQCMPRLPVGVLRHRREEPVREVPPLTEIAWSMQSLPTNAQRPWVHFAPELGSRPYCRTSKFRKDPIRQGLGRKEAAHTGERPCPRCVNKLGASAQEVMAEFCLLNDA